MYSSPGILLAGVLLASILKEARYTPRMYRHTRKSININNAGPVITTVSYLSFVIPK